MSSGINKAIIIGNVGADPEVKFTQAGVAIANFSVATGESWTDSQSGEKKERTEWHRCVAFRRTAEVIGEYVRKGSKVYIEGKIRTRKWQDQSGQDRYTTEISVDNMQMLDSRREGAPAPASSPPPAVAPEIAEFSDDDIPF